MPKYFWRKYHCNECNHEWDRLTAYSKNKGIDPLDECPNCTKQQENATVYQNKAPGMKTNISRAADFTAKMLESDYGIAPSMLVDNAREGDSYVKVPDNMPKVINMQQQPQQPNISPEQAHNIIQKQIGALGDRGVGVDFVKNLKIPDPRKDAEFMMTRD